MKAKYFTIWFFTFKIIYLKFDNDLWYFIYLFSPILLLRKFLNIENPIKLSHYNHNHYNYFDYLHNIYLKNQQIIELINNWLSIMYN